ncbi:MAG: energy transducer TonB [Flavobacteriaceae bacterium]|nr:energy transducer TonB [Flavobacteriaceae bacterium]
MKSKKSEKATLENYSKFFFQLGLALALLVVYLMVEQKSYDRAIDEIVYNFIKEDDIEDIPITERIEQIKPPPPPPAAAPEKIEIIKDEAEIEETVLESTEINQDDAVVVREIEEIEEVVEEEEIVEDVPFAVVEEAPIFPGCKGTKEQKKKCFQEKVREHINKKFNTELGAELGLEEGKKRVYVQFKVNHTGNIVDIRTRGPHVRLEKEAHRVIQSLPKMKPARQRDRAVGVRYSIPITFWVKDGA